MSRKSREAKRAARSAAAAPRLPPAAPPAIPDPVPAAEPPARPPLQIHGAALNAARSRHEAPGTPWTIPDPPPGMVPKGEATIAMDSDVGGLYEWAGGYGGYGGYGGGVGINEGLFFPGYPYLAQLTQRPEYRRGVEIIAREMTREWLTFTASGDGDHGDKLAKLDAAFKRLNVQDCFRRAAEHDGFFGRGQIYLDTGATDRPDELTVPMPAVPAKIAVGGLKRLAVVEPLWTYPADYNSNDPLHPHYYKPQAWYSNGKKVHASRWLTMIGREMPDILKPAYLFGGLSLSQLAKPYIDNWLSTRASVAALIHSFSVSVIKTNMGAVLAGGVNTGIMDRIAMFNAMRDNSGAFVLDKESEEFANVSTPLGTLDHLQAQAQEHISSIYGIPLIVFFGITPSGLNASSEGELAVWHATILAMQKHLFGDAMDTLLRVVQLSEFGMIDDGIGYVWAPLGKRDEAAAAAVRLSDAQVDFGYLDRGALAPEEVRGRIADDDESLYPGLDVSDVPEPPGGGDPFGMGGGDPADDQEAGGGASDGRRPFAYDTWVESDHPRGQPGNAGEFGPGGGGGSPKARREKAAAPRVGKVMKAPDLAKSSGTADYETEFALMDEAEFHRAAGIKSIRRQGPHGSRRLLTVGETRSAIMRLPKSHRAALKDVVVENVEKVDPFTDSLVKSDTGYAGMYSFADATVTIADFVETKSGKKFALQDAGKTTIHELGHALDHKVGFSSMGYLTEAFDSDTKRLTPEQASAAEYYTSHPMEMVAETYAMIFRKPGTVYAFGMPVDEAAIAFSASAERLGAALRQKGFDTYV